VGGFLELVGLVVVRLIRAAALVGDVLALLIHLAPVRTGCTKERAYIASMKSDLRNLAVAQESHFADHGEYAPALERLPPGSFQATTGTTVVLEEGGAVAWKATAIHQRTRYRCSMFVGEATPPRKDAVSGEPGCWAP
jgi:hypothetical protein